MEAMNCWFHLASNHQLPFRRSIETVQGLSQIEFLLNYIAMKPSTRLTSIGGFILLWAFFQFQVIESDGANIIALLFFTTKSIKNAIDPILYELARKGHKVTVVSPIHSSDTVPNLRNIIGPDVNELLKNIPNSYDNKIQGRFLNPFQLIEFFTTVCRSLYDMPEVEALKKEKFDLVIVNGLMNECAYGLMNYFNTTSIAVSPLASPVWFSPVFGAPTPPSFVPLHLTELTDNMNFFERLENTLGHIWVEFMRRYHYIPEMEKLYRDYFPGAPGILQIEKNFSLVLMNSHPILNYPRPLLPDMIEIGGIHCRPAKPLPKELEEFATGSGPAGFIFFSMGSVLRTDQMPAKTIQDFLTTFAKLKQRVIWKWEGDMIPNLPSNIKLSSWLPQQDILGHPNIRLFITHGGLLSTQEAVYHGVPLIGIPMVLDQVWNVKQAENAGYALVLQFPEITAETLEAKLNTILSEPSFAARAKSLSVIFRDQSSHPLDRAVFWTEYVLRHKGALHLRSPARHLNFFQYHSLDVIGLIAIPLMFGLYLLLKFTQFTWTKYCSVNSRKAAELGKKKRK